MHSRQSFFLTILLAAALLLAATACSVETREERQTRLAAEELAPEQGAEQVAETAAETAPDTATEEPAMEREASPLKSLVPGQESGQESAQDAEESAAPQDAVIAPDQAPEEAVEPAPDALFGVEQETAPEAEEDVESLSPAEVVSRFFTLAPDRDLAALEPLVTKDQRADLTAMLADLEKAMTEPGDQQLQGVDKVDVLQATQTAVVDVNVTLRFAGGVEIKGNSIQLRFEDGAWRISKLDF